MATGTRKSLVRPTAFWDSSALVPLSVRQPATQQSLTWYKKYDVAAWWVTPVEIASALARLLRIQQITSSQWVQSVKLAREMAETWFFIEPTNSIRLKAVELVERYDLHAADSLQMSAALEWCEGVPTGRIFLTADKRLQDVARLVGFNV